MTREELWLAAIAGLDGVNPPDYPVWHYEEMLAAIYDAVVGADSPRQFPERSWHLDEFLYAVYCVAAGLDDPGCPEPTDRIELFWKGVYDGVKGEAGASVPTPVWRIEEFLSAVFTASAGWGERTLTGSIVSFIGRASTEILGLTASITPVQSFNGYDHPWPAGGGKNKLSIDSLALGGTESRTKRVEIDAIPAGTYTFTATNTGTETSVGNYGLQFFDDVSGGSKVGSAVIGGTFTLTGEAKSIYIYMSSGPYSDGKTVILSDMMVRLSSESDATYAPYSNICPITGRTGANVYVSPTQDVADATTYPVTWQTEAGTVYGGTVDVTTGVLTVDRAYITVGDKTWSVNNGCFRTSGVSTGKAEVIACSDYKIVSDSISPEDRDDYSINCGNTGGNNTRIYIKDTSFNGDAGAFKTAMASCQIVFNLATPLTYQLTPQTVTALLGQNYVWADTGDVTVTVKGAGVA